MMVAEGEDEEREGEIVEDSGQGKRRKSIWKALSPASKEMKVETPGTIEEV
jgi:hypothetical protein